MAGKPHHQQVFLFLQKILLTKNWNKRYFQRKASNSNASQSQFNKYPFLANGLEKYSDKTLMFHTEGVLLKSSSLFPCFLLTAFEAGGLLRAFVLFLLFPVICFVGKDWGMKIMVFVCFVGLKEKSFRIGKTVLPKFLLEDVGNDGFDMVMKFGGRKIGVTDMPRVMVECFLKDYLKIEAVIGRELKVVRGHFVGLMEEKKATFVELEQEGKIDSPVIAFNRCLDDQQLFSSYQTLPREKYPTPLIFHDGRLAFRPTSSASLYMFMWIPFGILLLLVRLTVGLLLPYKFSLPFLSFTGFTGTLIRSSSFATTDEPKQGDDHGVLYVCNHRTLCDPIYVSFALQKPLTAVTYSLSRVTEFFAPIKTVRLTRNREEDSKMIVNLLKQGDVIICPEGTTCREPYLLRFSPLFAELTDEIVPLAIDFQVSMFYGTTAGGLKFLDPVFLLMNPTTHCSVTVLEKLPKCWTCQGGGKSKFEVANHVQAQIAKALNFECTSLTRRDKYMMLADNDGNV